ncbi:MAG: phosphatidate cytidylyltransferase [Syntrophaceae bacterium]|nr:phosphatidate cytidylyltransferase [Syntrophaceae bacterium]
MNSQLQRWITGIVTVPILFAVIAYGSEILFSGLIAVAALLGVGEFNRLAFGPAFLREKAETFGGALLILGCAAMGDVSLLAALLTFCTLAALMLNLWPGTDRAPENVSVAKVLFGILYIPLLMSHFILIRQTPDGAKWVFFILVVGFVGDIAAYYVGKGMGKRKLLSQVSPGKTVEGVIGLFVGSTVGALLFAAYYMPSLPWQHAALMGLLGGITGQLGDLAESALKRSAGAKDSGKLLPGHGGILDRLDSLIFIAPFIFYYRVTLLP